MADLFRCVVVCTMEPNDPGTFSTMLWWDCEFDYVAAGLHVEDPEHALDTPLPGPGFWIWEGIFVGEDWKGEGLYRAPTEPEWQAIRQGRPPWDIPKESKAIELRNLLLKEHPELEPQLRYGTGFYLREIEGVLYLHWVDQRRLRIGERAPEPLPN